MSALCPAAGTEFDHPVAAADDLHVVFDEDDGVARIAQGFDVSEEVIGVLGVETGRELVEDVDHAVQAAVQVGGQAQTLELPGGQGRRRAAGRQVADAEALDDVCALVEFVEEDLGGLIGGAGESFRIAGPGREIGGDRTVDRPGQIGEAARGHLGDVRAVDGHRQSRGVDAAAVAVGAGLVAEEFLGAFAHRRTAGGDHGVEEVAAGAAELARVFAGDVVGDVFGLDRHRGRVLGGQQPGSGLFGQAVEGDVDVDAHGFDEVSEVPAQPSSRPGGDRAFADAQ